MIVARVQDNLLTSGTVLTSASAFEPACPAANLFTLDPRQAARWVGQFVVDATNNKVDITNGGGAQVATLASATYYSPTAYAQEKARALTAAHGAAVTSRWYQGSTLTHRFIIELGSAIDFNTASGPNTAVSALRFGAGYRNQDSLATGGYSGDFACIHWPHDQVIVDLAAPLGAHASFLVRPDFSPGARVYVKTGSAATLAGGTVHKFTDAAHSKLMACFYAADSAPFRYAGLFIQDPHREDAAQVSLGYWWHGPVLDTDHAANFGRVEWEATSYSRKLTIRRSETPGISGQPFLAGMEPGETFTVAFRSAPGISPAAEDAVRSTLARIGTAGLAFVALKPTTDPHRETKLCRITPSELGRTMGADKDGRLSVSVTCEVQAVA